MVGTVGMLAATVYLLMASREVDAKYRRGVYISALVTGIAYYPVSYTHLTLPTTPYV